MRPLFAVALVLLAGRAWGDDQQTVLDGRVTGPDGTPVAGAIVYGGLDFDTHGTGFEASVAADGTFELRLTPSGSRLQKIRAFAHAPGFSDSAMLETTPKGSRGYRRLVLKLRLTVSHVVTIVDERKEPVAGATVTIATDSLRTDHPLKGVPHHVDAAGTVTFSGINDRDDIAFVVAASGFLDARLRAELSKPQTLTIARGGLLHGRVIDRETGEPVACAFKSYFYDANGAYLRDITTDANGNFELVAPYGPVTVLPSPNCRDYGFDYDVAPRGLEIRWTEATAAEVHAVRARRTLFVTVRVVDAKGAPAAGIRVRRTLVPQNAFDLGLMRYGRPSEDAVTAAGGEVVFASSMDRFDVLVEAKPPITRQFQSRLLNGPIVITLP